MRHLPTSSSRPYFTRSQSVPEQADLFYTAHDSGDEELFLEAAAASLDQPLPIVPSHVHRYSSLSRAGHFVHHRSSDPLPPAGHLSRSASDLYNEKTRLLAAELQAAAAATRRLTSRDAAVPSTSARRSAAAAAFAWHSRSGRHRTQLASSPITLGRSLQLVTESLNRPAKNVRFDRNQYLPFLEAGEDAWMSVEDVRSGRWARWDALVKQESQDSATRDSGIETGSCFTSSEDSNRGSASEHFHYHRKVSQLVLMALIMTGLVIFFVD